MGLPIRHHSSGLRMGASLRHHAEQRASRLGSHHQRSPPAYPKATSAEGLTRATVGDGTEMQQWQYEVTAGGRIWYCIDDANRTVWMTAVHVGHPKATE